MPTDDHETTTEYRVVWHRRRWTGSTKSRRFARLADAQQLHTKLAQGDDFDVLRIEQRTIRVDPWQQLGILPSNVADPVQIDQDRAG